MPSKAVQLNSGMPFGYSSAYGGVPNLPSTGSSSSRVQQILNSAIPGFSGLTKSASSIVGSALSGEVPQDVQDLIQNRAAEQAVMGGMPGSSRQSGTLFGNRTLRDFGLTSMSRQDQGVRDLLSLLGGFSGTVAPTFGQQQDQGNTQAQYLAAPNPQAASNESERLYNKYANPAAGWRFGTVGGGAGAAIPIRIPGLNF